MTLIRPDIYIPETKILVTGVFNIVQAEHIRLLENASMYGLVTVGIAGDITAQRICGLEVDTLENRVCVLQSNRFIHKIAVFLEDDPSRLIRQLRPEYYARSHECQVDKWVEEEALREVGARVLFREVDKKIISKILDRL